jgi:hypothetical protein
MSETAQHSTTAGNGPAEPPRESIDQVRDLLFGSQMKMVDSRLQGLDEKIQALGAEIRESLQRLERRHQALEQTAAQADADLRDTLLKQSAALSAEIATTGKRITGDLDRISGDLQREKLDAAALAAGLTDLAGRIAKPATGAKQSHTS